MRSFDEDGGIIFRLSMIVINNFGWAEKRNPDHPT
jgi:hypothetical protein